MLEIAIYKESGRKKLWFAESGIELRNKLLRKIFDSKEVELVRLDFSDIEVTDASYAREAFTKLIGMLSLEMPRPQVLFTNVDEYVEQNLELSLKAHKKFAAVVRKDGSWVLIGKYTHLSLETLEALIKLREATTKKIAEKLKIELTTCNNRLSTLHEMSIITKQERVQKSGGIEYTYKAVI